jgi:hypothetical protein
MVRSIPGRSAAADNPHPRPGRPVFMPRLGYEQQRLLPLLYEHGIRMTVAPLYYTDVNPELALVPNERQMAQALDPCSHLRQRPRAARSQAFSGLSFSGGADAFDPERDAVDDANFSTLVADPLDLARGRGATLLLTTFHLVGLAGTRGRDLDLRIAEAQVAHFAAQRMDQPHPEAAVQIPRELFATIAVAVGELRSGHDARRLAEAYLELAVHGFWVKLLGFDERASNADIRAGAAFLSALREDGRPVASCGAGQLYLGLLCDDISASIGIAEGERFRFPTDWREATKNRKRKGRVRVAYHRRLGRSFRLGSRQAANAFKTAPCDCKTHPRSEPPSGKGVEQHTAILRTREASQAIAGERQDRREWLEGLCTKASWTAADASVEHTPLEKYRALFEGLDNPPADATESDQDAG